jgi:tetratricopeptide (TPR) repeat protein
LADEPPGPVAERRGHGEDGPRFADDPANLLHQFAVGERLRPDGVDHHVLVAPPLLHAGGDLGYDPYEVGEKYLKRQDYRLALKFYQQALDQNDARARYGMGRINEATGKEREALRQYELFMALSLPGELRNDAVRRSEALAAKLEKQAARSAELLAEGQALLATGKPREAAAALSRAAAENDANPEIHFQLGEAYLRLEEYGKAKAEFQKAKGAY